MIRIEVHDPIPPPITEKSIEIEKIPEGPF